MPDIRPSEPHGRTPSPELLSAVAHHEAGHALAIVLAFRDAAWLPRPPPPVLVNYVEITDSPAGWSGNCFAPNVYSVRWPIDVIAERYRPLMEAQVVIELSGGIAEAVFAASGAPVRHWRSRRPIAASTLIWSGREPCWVICAA